MLSVSSSPLDNTPISNLVEIFNKAGTTSAYGVKLPQAEFASCSKAMLPGEQFAPHVGARLVNAFSNPLRVTHTNGCGVCIDELKIKPPSSM